MKKQIIFAFCLAFCLLFLSCGMQKETLSIWFPKIGKADAALLQTKDGVILIDAGEEEDGQEILQCLQEWGAEKIDYLIITHFDRDHVGGAAEILQNIPVRTVLQPMDYGENSPCYRAYQKALSLAGQVQTVSQEQCFSMGELQFSVWPPEQAAYERDNDYSLVTRLVYGEHDFLFTGDAQEARLKELLARGDLKADVLKVPHHGKTETSSEVFFRAVGAKYAIINCSGKNPPDDLVLVWLEQYGAQVYQTKDGDVFLESDGTQISLSQENNG